MNLHKLLLTKNNCYKKGEKIKPKGIMVHSTGANNPLLKRYVGPDDGKLGKNIFGNHWNVPNLSVCVHAFIGKLQDGTIATYQTLPWDHRGWHAGSGFKGTAASANNTHISFEICEGNLKDAAYFKKVYQEAVELCAYLCKEYNLTEKDIICHSEGCMKGIASNHGDVMHWFPRHGKSMDTFRADVKALLNPSVIHTPNKTPNVVATGTAQGFDRALAGTYVVTPKEGVYIRHSASTAAKKMVAIPCGHKVKCYGYYTNALGVKWLYVQINYMGIQYTGFMSSKYLQLDGAPIETPKKTPSVVATGIAHGFDRSLAGTYTVTPKEGVYIRHTASATAKKMVAIPCGHKVQCYGYYTNALGVKWLYIQIAYMGVQYTGFMSSKYLRK